jgi:hypothetical protein
LTQFRFKVPEPDTELGKEWKRIEAELRQNEAVQLVSNLNQLDILPSISGKENAAKHILRKLSLDSSSAALL